ncbi:MAG: copper-containing nitrite reductase [Burkholderiaceae bacterium]
MHRFRLIPVAASIACALGLALPAFAQQDQAAATAKAGAAAPAPTVKRYSLHTNIVDGKMVYVDDRGQVNPTMTAQVGDTIEVELDSGEGAEHDFVIPELNVASSKFSSGTGKTTVRFQVAQPGEFTYFCSIPGHRQIGMTGSLRVTGQARSGTAANGGSQSTDSALALYTPAPIPQRGADPAAVDISADPLKVPAAIGSRAPQLLKVRMETVELAGKLDDGTSFTYWTFNRQVPGPMLRARVGDTVELTLANSRDSKAIHSIDLHAVTGGHGGGEHTQVAPGQEKTITFKALNPGLYVYHCATPLVPQHIAAGMYGMILIEPEGGLPKVEREYYVMQGDMYTHRPTGAKVHQEPDLEKMANELPDYYVFNGAVGALTKTHKLQAKVGETVRIYFGVGGPNKISSFHIIGEIFDRVYSEAALNTVKTNVQTALVAPGGASIVELKVEHPGSYLLVDHALSRSGKGAVGVLEVSGEGVPGVYKPGKS